MDRIIKGYVLALWFARAAGGSAEDARGFHTREKCAVICRVFLHKSRVFLFVCHRYLASLLA
ncbi:hypothetical protein SDC9_130816 [bioreactor metagenome]|uniref:Uncharacterized protein n=1 Tax=bioreactor metagenome TaxID=1076179 RepID=A0A645D3K6_9ZZZZ